MGKKTVENKYLLPWTGVDLPLDGRNAPQYRNPHTGNKKPANQSLLSFISLIKTHHLPNLAILVFSGGSVYFS